MIWWVWLIIAVMVGLIGEFVLICPDKLPWRKNKDK